MFTLASLTSFSHPHDQIREQVRLTVEKVKERQESELINNADYGLLNNVDPAFKIQARQGAPTPDDLDELALAHLEGTGFLPGPSTRHRRLRAGVHLPWCSSSHGNDLWFAFPDLAWHSARPYG